MITEKSDAYISLQADSNSICLLSKALRDDRELMLYAAQLGANPRLMSARLACDPEIIITAAKSNPYAFATITDALFCAKRDAYLRSKLSYVFENTEEYHILLKLSLGSSYHSPINRINCLSAQSLREELHKCRKKQLDFYRKFHGCSEATGKQLLSEMKDRSDLVNSILRYPTYELKKSGLPFCNITNLLEEKIHNNQSRIASYLSSETSGSYPERLMTAFLKHQSIDFIREMSFSWGKKSEGNLSSRPKRYDFYIPHLSTIIEVHGAQHYGNGFESLGGRSLEEEQQNDALKKELALRNGIANYIEINAAISSFEYIKQSIIENPAMCSLFDVNSVDWRKVEEDSNRDLTYTSFDDYPMYQEENKYLMEWIDLIQKHLLAKDYVAPRILSKENTIEDDAPDPDRVAFPSFRGLYPHEILFLSEAHRYKSNDSNQEFPSKWKSVYGIHHIPSLLDKLFEENFIQESCVSKTIAHSNLSTIKRCLIDYNLPTSGKKAELCDRLLECVPHEKLDSIFSSKYYELTKKGEQELLDNDYLFRYRSFLSIWTLSRLKHAFSGIEFSKIIEDVFIHPHTYLTYLTEAEQSRLLLGKPGKPASMPLLTPITSTLSIRQRIKLFVKKFFGLM